MNIGFKIRKLRNDNTKSMEEIANILNVAKITYNHYELQEKIIPIERLNALCNYYKVSIDYAFSLNNAYNYKNIKSNINQNLCAKRIRELRKDKNITQLKLALLIGTVQSTVSSYEKAITLIPTSFLYTICQKYNISADYLLGKIDEPKYLK